MHCLQHFTAGRDGFHTVLSEGGLCTGTTRFAQKVPEGYSLYLFTRPRCSVKSQGLSMLKYLFCTENAAARCRRFADICIASARIFCQREQYPVIS